MYADVKEIYPGAADRLQTNLRQLATTAAGQSFLDQPSLPFPQQAQLSPSNSRQSTNPQQQGRSGQSRPLADLPSIDTASQDSDKAPQFLLLCINTKRLRTLEHIEVTRHNNDEYLFKDIREVYKRTRESEEWRLSEVLPSWAPKPSLVVSYLENFRFLVPTSARFVKVCIAFSSPVTWKMALHSVDYCSFILLL